MHFHILTQQSLFWKKTCFILKPVSQFFPCMQPFYAQREKQKREEKLRTKMQICNSTAISLPFVLKFSHLHFFLFSSNMSLSCKMKRLPPIFSNCNLRARKNIHLDWNVKDNKIFQFTTGKAFIYYLWVISFQKEIIPDGEKHLFLCPRLSSVIAAMDWEIWVSIPARFVVFTCTYIPLGKLWIHLSHIK